MDGMSGKHSKGMVVDSPLGRMKLDSEGVPISGIRVDVEKAYVGVPELLQKVINQNDSQAWRMISNKIDYLYSNLDTVLKGLDRETGFSKWVKSQVSGGKKLLFKPNLLSANAVDEFTHGAGVGADYVTQWPFMAALMRWFHEKLEIYYFQMMVGEASPSTFILARQYSKTAGRNITTEAVIEGRSGDFYGGWGFFYVRKYLAEQHPASHRDDPMNGYEDSVTGRYFPPGEAGERLMVYDLNKVHEEPDRGRMVTVPGGANFREITIHKAIIGGEPLDRDDLNRYPGCVLVNLPRLKMHAQDLITNATKNLGIGLYPTQCATRTAPNEVSWKYAVPPTANPGLKAKLPHSPWVLQMDEQTCLPVKDEKGNYIATKTAGFSGTQSDIIRAVQSQNVFLLHVTDAIQVLNISHDPGVKAVIVPEGYIWAALDCVALDLFCARYCFKTVPMREAFQLKVENSWNTEFVRHVPVARRNGVNITTEVGIDSPLFRYDLYRYAEARGVGQQQYYVTGWDSLTETPLASLQGHLGRLESAKFVELMTGTMYYNPNTILHDLQKTLLSYAKANDDLTGCALFRELMDCFDENRDGVIDYDEKGRGFETAELWVMAYATDIQLNAAYGSLRGGAFSISYFVRNNASNWNPQGHDFMKEKNLIANLAAAYQMSQADVSSQDFFVPGMVYGRGMWPSWQTVVYVQTTGAIYGTQAPGMIQLGSLFGMAFQYADKVFNRGAYTGSLDQNISVPGSINQYFDAVAMGADPLKFTCYVPRGYGSLEGVKIPNVEETEDPAKILTIHFAAVW